jgi:hypothetical protein
VRVALYSTRGREQQNYFTNLFTDFPFFLLADFPPGAAALLAATSVS